MARDWEADPSALFERRLGRSAEELGESQMLQPRSLRLPVPPYWLAPDPGCATLVRRSQMTVEGACLLK